MIDLLLWPKLLGNEAELNFMVSYLYFSALLITPIVFLILGFILVNASGKNVKAKKLGFTTLGAALILGLATYISGMQGHWDLNNWLLTILYLPLGPILLVAYFVAQNIFASMVLPYIRIVSIVLAILLIYFVTLPVAFILL